MQNGCIPPSARLSELPCIAIATEGNDWHTRHLRAALRSRGFSCRSFSLRDCHVRTGAPGQQRLCLPRGKRPVALLVRSVPPGSFQQVILRLDMLRQLEAEGVAVWNSTEALQLAVDKAESGLYLARAGVAGPPTWVCQSAGQARDILHSEIAAGHAVLIKPLFGAQGRGLRLMRRADAAMPAWAHIEGVYYLQRFIPPARAGLFQDFRVFVIGGRAVAAMRRQHRHWITNRACGGLCHSWPLQKQLTRPAVAAARALRLDYAGVDLMCAGDDVVVLEVNGIPAWRGLQSVCSIDMAHRIVAHLCSKLPASVRAGRG